MTTAGTGLRRCLRPWILQTGKVIGETASPPSNLEFRHFLDRIEANVPAGLDAHLVMDNYGTHKTARDPQWFAKRPRFHVHFTPRTVPG